MTPTNRTMLMMMTMSMALMACAPATVIRRTALSNAPQALAREGLPLERGDVRLTGHVSANTADDGNVFLFRPGIAEVGDAGILIPDVQIGASAYFGVTSGFELGGQFTYASMSWASPNLPGVLSFPTTEERDLVMGGVGARFNINVGDPRFVLSLLGEFNVATIPEAVFVCADRVRCEDGALTFTGEELYRFDHVDDEVFGLANAALLFGWRFGDARAARTQEFEFEVERETDEVSLSCMPYLTVGVQSTITNTGFEDDLSTLPSDSLETLTVGYFGIGVDAFIEKLVLGASLMLPIEGDDAIDFGVVFNFRIGVQL